MLALLAAAALTLAKQGEAMALSGRIVEARGAVFAVDADERAFSPAKPTQPASVPADAQTIADDPAACRALEVTGDVPLAPGETLAAIAHGKAGPLADATVALVRGKREDDLMGYAPLTLEVFDGKTLRAKTEVRDDAYPCALVVDGTISVAWMSVGGGYSAGVTVFALR